jgi:NADH-quinone oxidoreductase subunit M
VIGVTGAVVLMVAHGLSAAMLFGLTGEITHRSGENRFAELGGLAKRAPVLAVLFSFASMATMGVPGLANFAGEVMVFFGSFAARSPIPLPGTPIPIFVFFAMVAIYGTVITAVFQLRAIKNVFYGPMPARFQPPAAGAGAVAAAGGVDIVPFAGMTDTSTVLEHGPYVLLIIASLVIGSMPFLLIQLVEPSVKLLPFLN